MRYGEDNYGYNGENSFFEDFSVYPTAPAASQFAVMPQQAAPQFAAMPAAAPAPGIPELTPELLAELQASAALMQQRVQAASDPDRNAAFDKYVADQAAKGVEVASTYTGGGGPLGSGGIFGITDFAPAFDPANPAGTTGQVVRFDEGKMNAPVVFQPGQQYVLTDASGENVVGRASSVEELQKLAAAQGNMPYGFQLYRADEQGQYQPGTQLFGETDPRTKGLMGAIVNYGLPIAAGIATGGASFLPAVAASAAASGAGKLMTGYTAGDAAKAAAIAGATRGVLKGTGLEDSLGQFLSAKTSGVTSSAIPAGALSGAPMSVIPAGALGGASASAIPAGAFSGLGSAAAGAVPEIVVTAAKNALTSAIPGAFSGAASGGFDQFLSDNAGMVGGKQPQQMAETPAENEIVVSNTATPNVDLSGLSALGGATPPLLETTLNDIMRQYEAPQQMAETPAENEIVVSNTATPKVDLSGIASLAGAGSPTLETTLNDIMRQYEAPQQMAETPAEDEILVSNTATPKVDLSGLSALSGAATGGFDQFVSDNAGMVGGEQPQQMAETPAEDEILVSNTKTPKVNLSGLSALSGAATMPNADANLELPGEKLIDVAGRRIPKTTLDSVISAGAGALAPTTPPVDLQPGEELIDVAGNRIPKTELDSNLSGAAAALVPNMPTDLKLPGEDLVKDAADGETKDKKGLSTVAKVGLGLSLLDILSGALGGGGGGGTPATAASRLNPIFSAKLPSSGSVVPGAAALGPRDMSGVDWKRYGFGPEKSFFNYVPADEDERRAMIAPAQPDTQLARGGALAVKKGGGTSGAGSFAVKGPGTGRSDEIPALLSDGEYVIDAETVAMLGDGSSEAGAKRLDDFRVNVRKHKGRNLAKGKFSANAKAPERYLSGGRVK